MESLDASWKVSTILMQHHSNRAHADLCVERPSAVGTEMHKSKQRAIFILLALDFVVLLRLLLSRDKSRGCLLKTSSCDQKTLPALIITIGDKMFTYLIFTPDELI